MPLDVLEQLNEARQEVSSDEQLTQNLDAIIEKAKSSSESMNALKGIVEGLTAGGDNLSDSLQKVCYYFGQFEEKSNAAKISAFGLNEVYNKFGKSAPAHFGKIISSLEEIKSVQNDLTKGFSLPVVNQVSLLTKEITKLRNALKDVPKIPTGSTIPVGKYTTGGEIPGNSTTGDKVPILVNSGEYVLNKAQMMKIGKMLGGKSPRQVFQEISGRTSLKGKFKDGIQAFASGGVVDSLHTFINNLPNSDHRKNRFSKLLQVMRDNAISNSDVTSRIPSNINFSSLSDGDIENLINDFKRILRNNIIIEPMSAVSSSDNTKIGRMFGDAQTAMKRTMLGITNEDDRKNQAAKIREAGSIQKQVNRIGKSGTREDKEKLEQLNRKFGIFDSSDIERLSPDDFKEYSTGLQEIKDHVDAVTDEVSKLEEEFDSTSRSITKMFKEWGIGNIVMIAGIVLMAQKTKEIAEGIQKWIGEIVQLNVETQKLQQNMNALGGSINMDVMREGLNLSRKEAIALGDAYKTIGLNAGNSMENVSMIASNLKNAFGQVDVSMLKEAVNLIKDLPNEQVEVLLTGKGSFDDKANLLTNLMKDGKLETTIDLMANGAFGEMEGSVKISPKDKALIETQNKTNKLLEDIKFGLYDWMPEGIGKLSIITTGFAQMATNAIQTYVIGRGIWMATRKIASAAGFGFMNVRDGSVSGMIGGNGSNGLSRIITSSVGRIISSTAIGFAVGETVGDLMEAGLNKISNVIKKSRDYELQAKVAENKRKYGHTQGDILDYFNKERKANIAEKAGSGAKTGAVIGGTAAGIGAGIALIGTGVGILPGLAIIATSALGGAAIGGGAGAGIGAGYGVAEGIGNPFEDAIDSQNNLSKSFYKDVLKRIDEHNKILYGTDNVDKKQLKELISINQYSKKMTHLLSKRVNSYQHESINADIASLRNMSQIGGSDTNFNQKLQQALINRIRLGRQESEIMSSNISQILNNKNISAEGKNVAINDFLNKQQQFISDFKDGIDNIIKMLFQSPEMLKRKFEMEIGNMQIDFGNKSFMDTSISKLSNNFDKSSQNIREASDRFSIASEILKTMDLNFDGVVSQAQSQKNEVMNQSGLDEDKARKIVNQYQEEANKIMKNGDGDVAVAVELLKEMSAKAKTQEEIMSNLPTAKETLNLSKEYFARSGEHEKEVEAEKIVKQLEDIEQVLSDPSSSESDRQKAIEQYKALINVGITNLHEDQLRILADLKKKFPKLDQAKMILGFEKIITNASNSKTMVAEKNKNLWQDFISVLEQESQNMGKQIEAAFNSGTITFTKALINALERQKKYDNIADALKAGEAAMEAAITKVNQLGIAMQNVDKIAEQAGIAINGGRDENGNVKEGINESYENRVKKQENGKEQLEEEARTGIKAYREKSIKRAELIRQASTTKDARLRAQLIAQIDNLSKELQNEENGNLAIKKWLESGNGEAFKLSLGAILGPLEKILNGQTEYKEAVIKSFEEIGNSVLNALEDGVVRLSKAIADASASRADYNKRFGNLDVAVSESRKSIEDSYSAQQEGVKKLEEAERIAHQKNLKNLQERMREAGGDQEKIRVAQIEYAKTEADITKNKFEGMKKLVQETVDKISAYITVKAERLGRVEESLNIEKDFANQIGAPFEYIVELEKATVQLARDKVKIAQEELDLLQSKGVQGEAIEKAKLKLQKAQAEELKASFGAQRDSIDKMLGKVMGTFQEIGGIFGPNSARMMAKKYGQGYMMNEAGLAVRAGQWTEGFNGRTGYTTHGYLPPRFETGGKIGGNSKNGDNILALVNSGEYILNPKQMENLKERLGATSQEEVFALANKELPKFANGGLINDPLFKSVLDASINAQRYSRANLSRYFDKNGNWKVQSIRQHGATPNNHYSGAYDISIDNALRHKHGTRFQEDIYDEDAERAKIAKYNAEIDEIIKNDIIDATPGALRNRKFQESTVGKGNSGSSLYAPYQIYNGRKYPTKEETLNAADKALRGGIGNMNLDEKKDSNILLNKISKDVEEILKILKGEINTVDSSLMNKSKQSSQENNIFGISQTQQIKDVISSQINNKNIQSKVNTGKVKDGGNSLVYEDNGKEIKKLLGEIPPGGNTIRDVENRNALAKFMSNPCKKKENVVKIQQDILDTVHEIRDLLKNNGNNSSQEYYLKNKFSPLQDIKNRNQIKPEKISPNAIGGMAYFGSQGKGSFLRNIKAVSIKGLDKLKSGASKTWEYTKFGAQNSWEFIKNSKLSRGIKGGWEATKSRTSKIWNGTKTKASGIWDGIKTRVSSGLQKSQEFFNEKMYGKVSQKRLHELQKMIHEKTGKRPKIKSIKQSLKDKSVVSRWQREYQGILKGNNPIGEDLVSKTARLFGRGQKIYDKATQGVKTASIKTRDFFAPKMETVKTVASKIGEAIKSRASKIWNGAKTRAVGLKNFASSNVGKITPEWFGNVKKAFSQKIDLAKLGFELGMSGEKTNNADTLFEKTSIIAGNKFKGLKDKLVEIIDSIKESTKSTKETFLKGYNNRSNNTALSRIQSSLRGIKDVISGAKNNFVSGYKGEGGTGLSVKLGEFTRNRFDNAKSRYMKGFNNPNAKLVGPSAQIGQMRRNFKEGFSGTHGGDSYKGANANERSFSYRTGKSMRNLVDGYNGVEGSKGLFSLAGKSTRGLVNLQRNFKSGYQGIPEVTGWSAGLGKGVRNIVDFGVGMKNNFMEGTSGGGKGVSGWAGRQVGRTGNFIKNASAQKVMGTAMLSQGVLGLFNSARQLNNIEDNEFQRDAMMREALIQGGQSAGSVLFGSNMLFSKNGSKMGTAGKAGMLLMAGSSLPGLFATKNVVDPQTGRSKKTWDGYAASYHAENLANLGLMLHPGLMKGNVNPKMFGWGMALQAGGTGINMLANNMSEGSAKNRVTATGDLLSSSGGIVGDIGMTMATGGINKIIEGAFDVGRKSLTEEGRRRAGNVGGTLEAYDTITKLAGTQTIFKGLGSGYDLIAGGQKGREYMDISGAISDIDNAIERGKAVDKNSSVGLTGKDAEKYAQLQEKQDALRKEMASFGRSIGQGTFFGLWGRSDQDIQDEMNANELEMRKIREKAQEKRRSELVESPKSTVTVEPQRSNDSDVKFAGNREESFATDNKVTLPFMMQQGQFFPWQSQQVSPEQLGQLTPKQQLQQIQPSIIGQPELGQSPLIASSTPISKESVSIMQRREAAGQKMFGESGSIDGQSASGGGKQQIEVTVNVKFNHAAFAAETVKVVTSGNVAQQITNRGMTTNG